MDSNATTLKKATLFKFKEILELTRKYSKDVQTAFILELDAFLENFKDTYHLEN